MNLRQEGRGREDADGLRPRDTDEYSRILGDEWESMGDGTYRFVGKQKSVPALPWSERPPASDESPARSDTGPESNRHEGDKKRRWRRHRA
jgi:hypothetical protein